MPIVENVILTLNYPLSCPSSSSWASSDCVIISVKRMYSPVTET